MEDLVATGNKETFNEEVYNTIMKEMKKYEASNDKNRFTNIEAGLKMAQEWLSHCRQKNKYVIFLSDGLPTVYLKDNQIQEHYVLCTQYHSYTSLFYHHL